MVTFYMAWNVPFNNICGVYPFVLAAAINWSLSNSCRAIPVKMVRIWTIFQAEMLKEIQNGGKYLWFLASLCERLLLLACDTTEIQFL